MQRPMFEITDLERVSLIDLLCDLQRTSPEMHLEIAEGLSILGYDEEAEGSNDLEDEFNDDDI